MKATAKTNWTKATTNLMEAIEGVKSALLSGRNAWIEKRKNVHTETDPEGCDYPLTAKNSDLDNPFNWTMLYGTVYPSEPSRDFFNETEKDLFYNWTCIFSTGEARETYISSGKIIEGLNHGGGICTPVRVEDANKTRTDGYEYKGQTIVWKPEKPYFVPNPEITEVYVVCTNDEVFNQDEAVLKLKNAIDNILKS